MKNLIKSTFLVIAILIGGSVMAQEETMMKKDEMKKESMMKKDEMKEEAMMKKDKMMSEAKTIKLVQMPGKFNKEKLMLKAGEPYVFEVENKGVDHAVGFVVAPKGKTDQANHIKNAYVKEMVKDGEKQMTNEVVLEKGEYVFFCPMNPTPEYSIIVK